MQKYLICKVVDDYIEYIETSCGELGFFDYLRECEATVSTFSCRAVLQRLGSGSRGRSGRGVRLSGEADRCRVRSGHRRCVLRLLLHTCVIVRVDAVCRCLGRQWRCGARLRLLALAAAVACGRKVRATRIDEALCHIDRAQNVEIVGVQLDELRVFLAISYEVKREYLFDIIVSVRRDRVLVQLQHTVPRADRGYRDRVQDRDVIQEEIIP